jgi:hypothetical protein
MILSFSSFKWKEENLLNLKSVIIIFIMLDAMNSAQADIITSEDSLRCKDIEDSTISKYKSN